MTYRSKKILMALALGTLIVALAVSGQTRAAGQANGGGAQTADAFGAISSTINRYTYAVDEMNRAMMADTFAADACLNAGGNQGAQSVTLRGRDKIVEFIMSGRAAQRDHRRHLVTNLWLDNETPTQATAHAYFLIAVAENGGSSVKSTGSYEIEMHRDPDHAWRMSCMRVFLDSPY